MVHLPSLLIVFTGTSSWAREMVPPLTQKILPLTFQALSPQSQTVIGATKDASFIGANSGRRISAPEPPAPCWMPAAARSCRAESGTLWVMRVLAPGEMALQVTP